MVVLGVVYTQAHSIYDLVLPHVNIQDITLAITNFTLRHVATIARIQRWHVIA
jgi:hypothetical protein